MANDEKLKNENVFSLGSDIIFRAGILPTYLQINQL